MSLLMHLLPLLACLHTVWPYPVQDGDGSSLTDFEARLAKKSFYPYKESILSPLGFLQGPRIGLRGQRKKAVDSTFIRFGRGSISHNGGSERSLDDRPLPILDESSGLDSQQPDVPEATLVLEDLQHLKLGPQQRFFINHNGCRITSAQDLRKVLLTDPSCFRSLHRAKKENVNDTFIRFGKREAPPEKEFESDSSARQDGTS